MNEKVLFVDDEPPVLDAFQRLLRHDFAVNTALGGYQGLAAIRSNGPFAVIISDMRMPEMDGVEFLSRAREKAPDSIRMLLTGHADLDAAIEAVNRGNIFRFLTKPCGRSQLMDAINLGLSHYRTTIAQRDLARKAKAIEEARSDWETAEAAQPDRNEDATGLPGPAEARALIGNYVGSDRQCYVVLIKLIPLHTVEERYGQQAVAEYRMTALQFIAQGLRPEDRLFQWSPDVMMAVIRRSVPQAAVRQEIARMLVDPPQHLVEQNGRKTMVAILTNFDLLPVAQFPDVEELMTAFKSGPIGSV